MKKRQKSRLAMYIIGGISAISLGSVGFASWVLTGVEGTTKDISVTVGTVDNQSITTEVLSTNLETKLCFDNAVEPKGDFFDNTKGGKEDMTFVLPVKFTGNVSKLASVSFQFSGSIYEAQFYGSESANYLIGPWVGSGTATYTISGSANPSDRLTVTNTTPSDVSDYRQFEFEFTFNWGKAFNYKNPGNVKETEDSISKADLLKRLDAFTKAFPKVEPNLHVVITPVLTAQ